MKLGEMKRLPKRAGKAVLSFEVTPIAERDGNKIVLPYSADDNDYQESEFFPLQDGKQFFFLDDANDCVWFGGTEENPFLVELDIESDRQIIAILREKGEPGFYEALKPDIIKMLENKFGILTKRQGDIWAFPMPNSWDEVYFILKLAFGWNLAEFQLEAKQVKNCSIFDTRHTLTTGSLVEFGENADHWNWRPARPPLSKGCCPPLFLEGVIEAPDHPPLELKGAHVVEQTKFLAHPEDAD